MRTSTLRVVATLSLAATALAVDTDVENFYKLFCVQNTQ